MWKEKETAYRFNIIENEGGKTLGYSPESGVKIIEKDGFAFKDFLGTGKLEPYEDWRLPAEERADDLAKRLSVEQVAGLMCFSAHQFNITAEVNEEQKTFLNKHLRSVLNSAGGTAPDEVQIAWSNNMQRYVEGKDFGIPCYFSSDPRNGRGVSDWPGNLGLAATFDPELALESAKCQAKELRDLGVACFLAPQVDISSDPRWFRNNGTFGEDPALSRDMVRAFCDGLQSTYDEDGNDLGWGKDSLTAMAKHWTGEGSCEGGREAHVDGGKYGVYPNNNFEALMIPFVDGAFKLKGKTGSAQAIMSSYSAAYTDDGSLGEVVGSSFSEYKIKELLRKRYGFTGVVCTDWMVLNEGIKEGRRSCGWGAHIEDPEVEPGERAFIAIMAGVDQMGGCSDPDVLMDAYRFGCEKVGKEVMDKAFAQSAQRLLQGYFLTGLFENPYLDEAAALADVNSADKQAAALEAQVKAVVMLKNEHGAVKKAEKRLKVYIPALYEAPHYMVSAFQPAKTTEPLVSYPLSLEVAGKYFDVVTDKVDGTNITRLTEEELKDIDLVLIPAQDPGNSSPQDGRKSAQGYEPNSNVTKTSDEQRAEAQDTAFRPLTRQYRPYTADGPYVRKVSIAGDILPDGTKENRSYFGQTALTTNEEQLDQILEAAEMAKKVGVPSVVAMFTGKPLCFHEFEPAVDGILVTFSGSSEALARIVAGCDEPSALLPMQMPKDMDDVERQMEDTPRDMECYTDSVGHKYDFAYGMNYSGVINDERVRKYSAAPLTTPENKGVC
ncbi:MAG: glycoside hydrolase family 3 C-terminal domain-containing protein [Lachnospiraceae bacterium]|nr:glycoside hydrolase family 3 C-terminal domain-containing protein [Lachnospiraceae bacterium]